MLYLELKARYLEVTDLNKSISKLIQALNAKGYDLLYAKKQFMGREGKPHSLYVLSKAEWNPDKGKYDTIDIYKTTSTIRMVLFLRDMWYIENGKELPTDNLIWNGIREQIKLQEVNS